MLTVTSPKDAMEWIRGKYIYILVKYQAGDSPIDNGISDTVTSSLYMKWERYMLIISDWCIEFWKKKRVGRVSWWGWQVWQTVISRTVPQRFFERRLFHLCHLFTQVAGSFDSPLFYMQTFRCQDFYFCRRIAEVRFNRDVECSLEFERFLNWNLVTCAWVFVGIVGNIWFCMVI